MAIEVSGLTKRYREKVAVDDISFSVADGGVFAFVGTNGAGKSTTIGCLTTVLPFDAGDGARREGTTSSRRRARSRARSASSSRSRCSTRCSPCGRTSGFVRGSRACRGASLEAKIARARRSDRSRRVPRPARTASCPAASDDGSTSPVRCCTSRRSSSSTSRRRDSTRPVARWSGRTLHELRVPAAVSPSSSRRTTWRRPRKPTACASSTDGRIIADGTPAELRAKHSRSVLTVTTGDPDGLSALARTARRRSCAARASRDHRRRRRRRRARHPRRSRRRSARLRVPPRADGRRVPRPHRADPAAGACGARVSVVARDRRAQPAPLLPRPLNVFFSLLGAIILFVLYTLFLGNLQTDGPHRRPSPARRRQEMQAFVDSWMFAGIVMLTTVTTGLGASRGARR